MSAAGSVRSGGHLALVILTALVIGPQLGCGLMLWDVGEVVFFAEQLRSGAVPGTDFVVNAYGPGRYVLFAVLFAVFGVRLVVLWAVFGLLRLVITALAFEIGLRLFRKTPALAFIAPLSLILLPGPLHKGFYVAGALALVLGLLHWLEDPAPRRALGFGVVLGLVAAFRMDLGAFGALVFLVSASITPRRSAQVALVALPTATLLVATAAALLAVGGVDALVAVGDQIVDDIGKNNRIRDPVMPTPATLVQGASLDAWLLWAPLPLYLVGFVVTMLVPSERRASLVALLLMGVLTCNQIRMKPEFGHLLQALPLGYLAWAVVCDRGLVADRSPLRAASAVALALLLPALVLVPTLGEHRGSVYTGSFTIPEERTEVLETAMGAVKLNSGEFEKLDRILRFLRAPPDGPLWVPTNQPLLYGLSGRPDVTGHVGLIYYADDPAREARYLARLQANPPPVAVFIDDTIEGPGRRLRAAAPRVDDYLREHYRTVRTVGDAAMMIRR